MLVESIDGRSGQRRVLTLSVTDDAALAKVVAQAAAAADVWASTPRRLRAHLLEEVADEVQANASPLIDAASAETALSAQRLTGELDRTANQLRFFGEVLRDGGYLGAAIDHKTEVGLPDQRLTHVPLGPVAVFEASNFPFAFGALGGDVASALAAGCPVIVKAHSGHPETTALTAEVVQRVLRRREISSSLHSVVYGRRAGEKLVVAEPVAAVGFTGSTSGGRALFDLAVSRKRPIPFYGELGSVNPLVVTSRAASERGTDIAAGIADSVTGSLGQLCTKPGLLFLPSTADGDRLGAEVLRRIEGSPAGAALTAGIARAYQDAIGESHDAYAHMKPHIRRIDASDIDAHQADELSTEVFGPFAWLVRYSSTAELVHVLSLLEPCLVGALHAETDDEEAAPIAAALSRLAGRIVFNGYPTGLRVSWATQHGGAYPSSTFARTSVGALAIQRWLRPISFQNAPQELLPDELLDRPAHPISRRIDGTIGTDIP